MLLARRKAEDVDSDEFNALFEVLKSRASCSVMGVAYEIVDVLLILG
jgi:hypothetical protein